MKTKLHSTKLLVPLAGSICGLLAIAALAPVGPGANSYADEVRTKRAPKPRAESSAEPKAPARSPDEALAKGLEYLLSQQHADGGWGQGGGWRQSTGQGGGRVEGTNVEDPSDLGNTCVGLVALLRAGHTPAQGVHRAAAAKALAFICAHVERADKESLYVTDVRDTQLQVKIGSYVDTFLTGWVLSELKDKVTDEAMEARRAGALEKVVSKIERNQRADGSYADNKGWAAVLSQGLASKALNGASRSGAKVSKQALDKDQVQNKAGLDLAKGDFSAPTAAAEPSSAGVSLYREAAKLGGLREKSKSNVARKVEAEKTIADDKAPAPAKAQAQQELKEIADDEKATQAATAGISGKLRNSSYVAGFGNNGGEEFLSYMNLTESMHEKGGQDWTDWREKMTTTICGAQNADGSWAGQHCITGRTFCTGTALLALLVERSGDAHQTSAVNPGAVAPVAVK
jgi:hypothetical protein